MCDTDVTPSLTPSDGHGHGVCGALPVALSERAFVHLKLVATSLASSHKLQSYTTPDRRILQDSEKH